MSHVKESSLKCSSWLEQQQLPDPSNPVLAHDVGLAHYWQAKKQGQDEEAVEHWQRVIANWAIVLESDVYWRDWCAERGQVYGKSITEKHVAGVKEKLSERLTGELADAAQSDSTEAGLHLQAVFYLEVKAIRLLKQTEGLSSPSQAGTQLYCGPLLARQLGARSQIEDFFRRRPASGRGAKDSLRTILTFIHRDGDQPVASNRDVGRQLRLCFSQLGVPSTYLEHEYPQRALDVLAGIRCSACEAEVDLQANRSAVAGRLPVRCRDDCADFARLNPAYAAVSGGRDLFYCHAVELSAGASLSLAYQALAVEPADVAAIRGHLHDALDIGQAIELHEALRAEIADLMLGWADGLTRDQRWDEAIALLEGADDFEKRGLWKGKLASLLNARGVQSANEKRWAESLADLRQAYELNRHLKEIRPNLQNVLHAYANAMYEAGNYALARDLQNEAIRLAEAEPTKPPVAPPVAPPAVPVEEAEPVLATELVLAPEERANPALFDEQGVLKLGAFDPSGKAILDRAREAAANMGEELLRIPALLLALTQLEDGETLRLLERQGITPQQLQARVRAAVPGAAAAVANERLNRVAALRQFDLWFSILRVFDLAWEIAQYDQGVIGEPHILYGLLISRRATKLFQAGGVDVDRMIEQAAWY